jgi:hypothetical protein
MTRAKREMEKFRRELAALEDDEDRVTDLTANTLDEAAAYKRQRDRNPGEAQRTHEKTQRRERARSASERRQFLELAVSNVRLDGQTVRYDLRKPFRILSEIGGDPAWRTREDSNLRPSDS